jgi:hypothetical protein
VEEVKKHISWKSGRFLVRLETNNRTLLRCSFTIANSDSGCYTKS